MVGKPSWLTSAWHHLRCADHRRLPRILWGCLEIDIFWEYFWTQLTKKTTNLWPWIVEDMQYHALQVASNNSLDRYVSHQNSPMILSQAMLEVGRCSRAVNPSSPLDLAPKLPSPGDCRPCTNYGRLASCRFCRSGFTRFLASPEVPVPMDLPDWGNRNDNVEPNGFTTRGRSARCRICPPIAVMIRCVAVHA